MVVGLLGIVRAEAAYVPIDPAWPPERIDEVLGQSGAGALVGPNTLSDLLPAGITGIAADLNPASPPPPARSAVAPSDLAYVVFTSGSTGKPKGVMVEHGSLAHLLRWYAETLELGRGDRMLQFSRLTFDTSVGEIFGSLASGATLCLIDEETATSPPRLADALDRLRITHLDVVPSVLALLPPTCGRDVRCCISGGETVPASVARNWSGGGRIFINAYGPAEATVTSTASVFEEPPDGEPPIGEPLPHFEAHVLDEERNPVPPGETGFLFLAGRSLARGYLGQAGETAKRFVPNPFSATPGARMYDTGDLVKLRSDGQLTFVGRGDRQVKIAGQRVEPGEIEAVLRRRAAGVVDCAVLAWRDESRRTRLVCHWSGSTSSEEVRKAANNLLPRHLVPALYRHHERLPLTSSGKIDRAALAESDPETPRPQPEVRTEGAQTILLDTIAEVLPEPPSAGRSFTACGGDSLDAMRVIARLPEALAQELSVEDLLGNRSLEELERRLPTPPSVGIEPREEVDQGGHLDEDWLMSVSQKGIWFVEQSEAGGSSYNLGVGIELAPDIGFDECAAAVETLVVRAPILARTTGYNVRGEPALIALEEPPTLTRSGAPGDEPIEDLLRTALSEPFELDGGPLFRARFYDRPNGTPVLLLAAHHLIADGWSLGLLIEDLHQILAGADTSAVAPSMASYASGEKTRIEAGSFEAELGELVGQFADAPPPMDFGAEVSGRAPLGRPGFDVDPSEAAAVRNLAAELEATPFMVLLCLLTRALGSLTGAESMVVGCPVSTRLDPALDLAVGHLVNLVPVSLRVSGGPIRADVRGTRGACLRALARRAVPYPLIAQRLAASGNAPPAIQVIFQVDRPLSRPAEPSSFSRIWDELTPIDASYPLALRLVEDGESFRAVVEWDSAKVGDDVAARLGVLFQRELTELRDDLEAGVERPGAAADPTFTVVLNQTGQYSIWPANDTPPPGWIEVGCRGPESACLGYIEETWSALGSGDHGART